MNCLDIKKLTKSYGNNLALNDFSVTLENGIYAFLGPNGAGKSTMINIIIDNLLSDKGEIYYNGKNIVDLGKDFKQHLGYVPQHHALYKEFTAKQYLYYIGALKGIGKKDIKPRVEYLLKKLNLLDVKNDKIGSFSGGMKQRLSICQGLLNNPSVLILDEPTVGLDPKERINFKNIISEMALNSIILLATHIVSDVEFISKEVILIGKGELIKKDTPANIEKEFYGKVFTAIVNEEQLQFCKDNYKISKISEENENIIVRIVKDTAPEDSIINWTKIQPSLEDVYLYLFDR